MRFDLKGLLQDEEFLLGAGLLTAGSKGQSAGEAIFPSLIQAAKIKKSFAPEVSTTKAVFSVKDNKNVLASEKEISLDKSNYLPPVKNTDKQNTLSKEALLVYNKMKNVPEDKFKEVFKSLTPTEKTLYKNKIANNPDLIESAVAAKIENQVSLDLTQMAAVSEYKLGSMNDKLPEKYNSVIEMVEAQMENNKEASFQQVLEQLINLGYLER